MATLSIGFWSGLIKNKKKRATRSATETLNVIALLKSKNFIAKIHNEQNNNKLISEFAFKKISIITPTKNIVIKKNRKRLNSFILLVAIMI